MDKQTFLFPICPKDQFRIKDVSFDSVLLESEFPITVSVSVSSAGMLHIKLFPYESDKG